MDRGIGHVVRRVAPEGRTRGYVEDAPAVALAKVADGAAAKELRRAQVDVHRARPVLGPRVVRPVEGQRDGHARVVHEPIDPSEGVRHGVEELRAAGDGG